MRLIAAVAALVLTMFLTAATAGGESPASSSAFSHGRVVVDDTSIHYVRAGSGPPVVLLHGWPQTWWAWHTVMPALARQHTVIAFDLPGLGDSSAPSTGYDKATTARRIRQAVHQLGFQRVAVVGHDVGALVAYPYARDYPAEVNRLVVVETPLSGFGLENLYGRSWHFLFNAAPAPIPERIMDNDDVSTYLGMIFDRSFQRDRVDRPAYFRAYSDPADRSAGYEYYRAFAADAADNQANAHRRLAMPVLAMGGQYSFGPGVAASFRQVADDVREVVAPDAAHFVPEENPEFFAGCALLFLGPAGQPPSRPELAGCVA
jgi:pimeloyl-ACP methyl ester carboxylesterase